MKALLEAIAGDSDRTWGTVLWAGVGHGSELPTVRRLAADRKILLEPHPALFSRLASRTTPAADERLLQVALWSDTGSRELHMVSNPVKSSLLRPTGLLARLPNLQAAGTTPVWAMDLDNLATELGIAGTDNLLILDIAGAEAPVLAAASRAVLGRFAAILVSGGEAGDYEGATPVSDVVESLLALGFEVADRGAHGEVRLERGAVVWELRSEQAALQAQVGDLARQLQDGAARASGLEQALAAERARADEAVARYEAEAALRTAAEDARMHELARWEQERDGLRALAADVGARDAQIAGLQQAVDEATTTLVELRQTSVQQQEQIAALTAERDRLAAASAATIAELKAGHATLQENAVQRQAQLEALAGERDRLAAESAARAAELQAAAAVAADQVARLQAAHDGQLGSLQQQVETLAADVKRLSEHASDIGRHRDNLAASESVLRTRLAEAATSRDQALQRAQAIEQQAGGTAAELQRLRTELAEASRAVALGNKLQMLREADLRDLQQRYEASQEVQARQHDMLMKLGERLSLASNYFRQLAASPGRDGGGGDAGAVVEPEEAIEVVTSADTGPVAAMPRRRRAPVKKPAQSMKAGMQQAAPRSVSTTASRKPAAKPAVTPGARKPAAKMATAPAAGKSATKPHATTATNKPAARKPAPGSGRRKT